MVYHINFCNHIFFMRYQPGPSRSRPVLRQSMQSRPAACSLHTCRSSSYLEFSTHSHACPNGCAEYHPDISTAPQNTHIHKWQTYGCMAADQSPWAGSLECGLVWTPACLWRTAWLRRNMQFAALYKWTLPYLTYHSVTKSPCIQNIGK